MRKLLSCILATLMLLTLVLPVAIAEELPFEERFTKMAEAAEPTVLPLSDSGEQLSIFMPFYGSSRYQTMDEHPVIKKIEELTGIDLVFICPPDGDDGTFFNTIVASGEYPDIFRSDFATYPGGIAGAIDDGVILAWNPLVEQYMPNFVTSIKNRGEKVYKHLVNDDGMYVKLGCYLSPPILAGVQHTGMVMRKDLLEKVGMEVPKTVDELTEVLRAFKTQLNMETPFGLYDLTVGRMNNANVFAGAWNTAMNAYQIAEDGSIYYSRTTDGFKEMLKLLNTWYNEGLIDRDFINRNESDAKKLLYTDRAAVTITGNWATAEMLSIGQSENPAFDLVGLSMMRLEDPDEVLHIGTNIEDGTDSGAWQIATTCKNPKLAAKFIDWLYTEEAVILTTFGVGEMEDGNKTYFVEEDGTYSFTDFMMKNEEWNFNTMRDFHTIQAMQSEYHNDFIAMQYDTDIQKQCWEAWTYNLDNTYVIPTTISRTIDEGRTYSKNQNEIETYSNEMMYKFICGELDIEENWDAYLKELAECGLEENCEIQKAAYERWLNR